MKKKTGIAVVIGLLTITLLGILGVVGVSKYIKDTNTKVFKVDGEYSLSQHITNEYFEDKLKINSIKFTESNESWSTTYEELGIKPELTDDTKNYLNNEFILELDMIKHQYNTDGLRDKLDELNTNRIKNKYAKLLKGESNFEVKEEKRGNLLNIDKLEKYILLSLEDDNLTVNLEDYYCEFDESKPTKKELDKEIEKVQNTKISYTNGYEIALSDLYEYLEVDKDKIKLNTEKESEYTEYIDNTIEKELISYDTVGKTWQFKTHSGKKINVTGGTYGDYFSSDNETQYIIEKFKNFDSEKDREPIFSQKMTYPLKDNYIEVSISEQHVWVYKDGKCIMDSACVTGTKGKHDTPKGVYYISERINGKYLTGDDYKTWVNKWMRLTNRGVGFHDATWRGSFGGSIYTYSGSHGCINLPMSFASKLFDTSFVKMPVVIY